MAGLEVCMISEGLKEVHCENPIPTSEKRNLEKGKSFQTQQGKSLRMYCAKPDHRFTDCRAKKTIKHQDILRDKKLCFKCTGPKHRAAQYRSKTCSNCKNKHHTSLCGKLFLKIILGQC